MAFQCPTCSNSFPLQLYLTHAQTCTGIKEDISSDSMKNEESDTSRESAMSQPTSQTSMPVQPAQNVENEARNFPCPICNSPFTLAEYAAHAPRCLVEGASNQDRGGTTSGNGKRPAVADGTDVETKRSRSSAEKVFANCKSTVEEGDFVVRLEQSQSLTNSPSVKHAVLPPSGNQGQPFDDDQANLSESVSNSNGGSAGNNVVNISNNSRSTPPVGQMVRNENMSRPQMPAVAHRIHTPPTQGLSSGDPVETAAAYQPQRTGLGQMNGPLSMSTPHAQVLPQINPRCLKGENVEANGAGTGGGGGGPTVQEIAEAVMQKISGTLRRLEGDLNDVRQRVEMFEASMMMKLGKIEKILNRLNDRDPN